MTRETEIWDDHDEHYQKLAIQPRDVIRAWSKFWPSQIAHPLGEVVSKIGRCGVKGQLREDLEKARRHITDALEALE